MAENIQEGAPLTPGDDATTLLNYARWRNHFYGDEVVSVRRIPPNRRSITGLLPSRKNGRQIAFESNLERDFVTLLEFDQAVESYDEQPLELRYRGPEGRWRTGYPDFLVHFVPRADTAPLLCDVKYRSELFKRWKELKPRLKAAYAYARERGWDYRIKTEVEIRTPYLINARFLLPYGRGEPNAVHELQLTEKLDELGDSTPEDLLLACCGPTFDRAILVPTLWCLVARRFIGCDLRERLTMRSTIWSI